MSSATVGTDGTTVTITWSENLDQTQAVPGSAFSMTPTAASESPAPRPRSATRQRTRPASRSQRRPPPRHARAHLHQAGQQPDGSRHGARHRQPGRHRHVANGSITNNTTNAAPSTPALVSPADTARLNTATPTLTATFLDPDTQDTGKVTFEVCTTSNCSSSLGTFDSSSTSLAVNANGSAAVPAGFNLDERHHLLLARQERRQLRDRARPSARPSPSSSTPPRRR